MNIPKAIEVNKDNVDFFEGDGYQECADAIKLGIEALKRIEVYRNSPLGLHWFPLPGETKD